MFFDGEGVTDDDERKNPSDGTYRVAVVGTDVYHKEDKTSLRVKFEILDAGRFKNWKVSEFFTVEGGSEMGLKTGRSKLKRLCLSVGQLPLKDHADLIGRQLFITLKTSGEYQNVNAFKAIEEKAKPTVAPAAQRTPVTFEDDDLSF